MSRGVHRNTKEQDSSGNSTTQTLAKVRGGESPLLSSSLGFQLFKLTFIDSYSTPFTGWTSLVTLSEPSFLSILSSQFCLTALLSCSVSRSHGRAIRLDGKFYHYVECHASDDDVGIGIKCSKRRRLDSRPLSRGRAIAEWRFSRVLEIARKLPLGCVLRKIREKCRRIEIIQRGEARKRGKPTEIRTFLVFPPSLARRLVHLFERHRGLESIPLVLVLTLSLLPFPSLFFNHSI